MSNASILRTPLMLLLSLSLAACATTPTQWEKPGSDNTTTAQDTSDCRIISERQAQRAYPPFTGPIYAAGTAAATSQQRIDTDRAITQSQSFASCMQSRGYVRRTVSESAK